MAEVDFTIEELDDLSRKDLQALAKKYGIRANLKSAAIIEQLVEYYNAHCPEDKENSPNEGNIDITATESVPVEAMDEEESGAMKDGVEAMEEEEEVKPVATPKKAPQPSPVRRTLPKNPVPPSPMQKFAKNASAALTPRKTPLRPTHTPAKGDMYTITPRKHKNKKNLFNPTCPQKQESSSFESDPFADFETKAFPVSPFSLFTVLSILSEDEALLTDLITVNFVSKALSWLVQSIVRQAMSEEGVTDRKGFVLKQESYNKALGRVLAGELGKNALFESCKIRERYQQYKHEEWDAKILGLAIDYIPLGEYLEEMQVETESVEDLLALAACVEYISSEIWELAERQEYDCFSLIHLDAVLEAIKTDAELYFTFKKVVESELSPKPDPEIVQRLPQLLSSNVASGSASAQEIKSLESALRFSLPIELKTFLSIRNGEPRLGVDSCKEIEDSTCTYQEVSIVYSLMNWVPIRSHRNGDVWDCYDIQHGLVVRASMLPEEEEDRVYPEKYKVLAQSFAEYLELHKERDDEDSFLPTTNTKTLKEVNPSLASIASFWINITEEVPEEDRY